MDTTALVLLVTFGVLVVFYIGPPPQTGEPKLIVAHHFYRGHRLFFAVMLLSGVRDLALPSERRQEGR